MYGLYFHGYYGEYDNRGLNHKKVTDLDFLEDYTIEETIHISHKKDDNNTITELKITGNFINTPEQIKKYDGELYYKNNRLEEGIITIEHEDTQIKYNVLWVG